MIYHSSELKKFIFILDLALADSACAAYFPTIQGRKFDFLVSELFVEFSFLPAAFSQETEVSTGLEENVPVLF